MIEPLTEREQEILILISQGMSNKAIADHLFLSQGTVKAHSHNIYGKLGVTSRTQALRYAQEVGLLTPIQLSTAQMQAYRPHLPVHLTPLIGRELELNKLKTLVLDEQIRLITIHGAGGMGKTRLAGEAAHHLIEAFTHGVFFVGLTRVSEPQDLAAAIIEDLGVNFQRSDKPTQQLLTFLKDKNILLVLDNFEHLMESVHFLAEILQAAPGVKLLITSRERLNLSMEVLFVLRGLKYGGTAHQGSAAVQLLIQQAQLVNPHFIPQEKDWPHIQRICQLTQGMPLAIVLAAGWLELLTLEEIAHEIARSIDILETQLRDVPERQRSMRATITSSWDYLTVAEKRVFIRLSVFRGSFTREAAQIIAGAGLRELQTLVNRSFIMVSEGHYEIHELLRQYGWEELQRASHAPEVYAAHSRYYLSWLHRLEQDLKGQRQIEAMNEISTNLNNIRQAWRWAVHTKQDQLLSYALEALATFFWVVGRVQEGADLLQKSLEGREESLLTTRIRIRWYSLLLQYQDKQLQMEDLEQCLQSAEKYLDKFEIALGFDLLGSYTAYVQHAYAEAIQLQEKSLNLLISLGETFHRATAYHKLGYCHLQVTGMATLVEYTEKAYLTAKQAGNLYNMSAALGNLGSAELYLGHYEEAETYYRESLPVIEALGYGTNRSQVINFTHILFLMGKFDEGRERLNAAWNNAVGVLDVNGVSFGHTLYSFLASIDNDYASALHHAMISLGEERNDITGSLVANLSAAMACCGLQDAISAEHHLREAFKRSQQMNFYASVTWGLPALVISHAQQGRLQEAAEYDALLRTHPLSAKGWLKHWALFVETETFLHDNLDEASYLAATQRGQTLSLEVVVAQFVDPKS